MAAKQTIRRGDITFAIFEKSIQVTCVNPDHPLSRLIHLGRQPDESDINTICALVDLGAAIQAKKLRDCIAARRVIPDKSAAQPSW
jgi:hypothetical protein